MRADAHLDDGRIQHYRDGELSPAVADEVRAHLARCDACRARADAAADEERALYALLRAIDHPVPDARAGAVLARAARRPRPHRTMPMRWAAGALLAIGVAGAAYAAPGSPLRAWVAAALSRPAPRRVRTPNVPAIAPAPSGIAVAPGASLVIDFTGGDGGDGGEARVSLGDGAEVEVRAPAGAATFTSDDGRLVVDRASSRARSATRFDVVLPRSAPRVEIRVDGERVLRKRGARVATSAPGTSDAGWRLSLVRP